MSHELRLTLARLITLVTTGSAEDRSFRVGNIIAPNGVGVATQLR